MRQSYINNMIEKSLLEIGAVKLSPQDPFTWTSGIKSPIYCDNRKLLSYPKVRSEIIKELTNLIQQKFNNCEIIAGVSTAGIPWGCLIANLLNLPFVYVRPTPKAHGMGNQVEGDIQDFKNVVIVEDLVSTGISSSKVVDVLEKQGMDVLGVVSVFDYQLPVSKQLDVERYSLGNYKNLCRVAVELGYISKEMLEGLESWRLSIEN
jgi:orotate phosphoribosyltransferase